MIFIINLTITYSFSNCLIHFKSVFNRIYHINNQKVQIRGLHHYYMMTQQATQEELMKLPSVGETTAEILINQGYGSFRTLVKSDPLDLYNDCGMVLSSATHIISAASEHLNGTCPRCGNKRLSNSWERPNDDSIPENAEIVCESSTCGWYGEIDSLDS